MSRVFYARLTLDNVMGERSSARRRGDVLGVMKTNIFIETNLEAVLASKWFLEADLAEVNGIFLLESIRLTEDQLGRAMNAWFDGKGKGSTLLKIHRVLLRLFHEGKLRQAGITKGDLVVQGGSVAKWMEEGAEKYVGALWLEVQRSKKRLSDVVARCGELETRVEILSRETDGRRFVKVENADEAEALQKRISELETTVVDLKRDKAHLEDLVRNQAAIIEDWSVSAEGQGPGEKDLDTGNPVSLATKEKKKISEAKATEEAGSEESKEEIMSIKDMPMTRKYVVEAIGAGGYGSNSVSVSSPSCQSSSTSVRKPEVKTSLSTNEGVEETSKEPDHVHPTKSKQLQVEEEEGRSLMDSNVRIFESRHQLPTLSSPAVVSQRSGDMQDDRASKTTFLQYMNLMSIPMAEKLQKYRKKTISKTLHQKLSVRKTQTASYFRNNPVPLSSDLGKKIILQAGFGKCSRPEDESARYDKYCNGGGGRRSAKNLKEKTWRVVNTRKFKKPSAFCHKYSFTKTEKIARLNEFFLS